MPDDADEIRKKPAPIKRVEDKQESRSNSNNEGFRAERGDDERRTLKELAEDK